MNSGSTLWNFRHTLLCLKLFIAKLFQLLPQKPIAKIHSFLDHNMDSVKCKLPGYDYHYCRIQSPQRQTKLDVLHLPVIMTIYSITGKYVNSKIQREARD